MRELTSEPEQALLQRYASGIALEIGSYDGASAIALSAECQSVHCVDPFLEDPGTQGAVGPSVEQFIKHTAKYGNIHLHYGKSVDILPMFRNQQFDFAFVDGAHFFMAALFDILSCIRLVRTGGHIAIHDTDWTDVANAMQASNLGEYATQVDQVHCLMMFQRNESPADFSEWATTEALFNG